MYGLFLVFCSFRSTVNVLGFVLMFLFYSNRMGLFVGFLCANQSKFIRFGFAVFWFH